MKVVAKLMAALFVLLVVLALVLHSTVPRPGSRTRAYLGIVNTLRQIDGAKQQYAMEHRTLPETVLSREQLLLYLPEHFWNSHAIYKINAMNKIPEAMLPAAFDDLPANTVIRLQTNEPGYQIIPPNHSAAGKAGLYAVGYYWFGAPELAR